MTTPQPQRAKAFRELHRPGDPLVLANVWDVFSARIVERLGAPAVATTSAGVAWSHGARDGERLARHLLVETVSRIVAAVAVPVSADIEGGYGAGPGQVADTVRAVVAAGAVGVNLEDTDHGGGSPLHPVAAQSARLGAARRAADESGVPLVINARVDTYLRAVGDPATRLAETVRRATAYLEAGADGVFVIGAGEPAVAALVEALDAPVNVLLRPGGTTVAEWASHGVARISTGTALAELAYATAHAAARELLGTGDTRALGAAGLSYADLDELAG